MIALWVPNEPPMSAAHVSMTSRFYSMVLTDILLTLVAGIGRSFWAALRIRSVASTALSVYNNDNDTNLLYFLYSEKSGRAEREKQKATWMQVAFTAPLHYSEGRGRWSRNIGTVSHALNGLSKLDRHGTRENEGERKKESEEDSRCCRVIS